MRRARALSAGRTGAGAGGEGRGGRGGAAGAGRGGAGPAGSPPAGRVADMAGSRRPRQLFLQGVAAVYMCAFASLYTQIPGEDADPPAPCAPSSPLRPPAGPDGSVAQALMRAIGRGLQFVLCRPRGEGRRACNGLFPVGFRVLTGGGRRTLSGVGPDRWGRKGSGGE